jgi:hypothetical protein
MSGIFLLIVLGLWLALVVGIARALTKSIKHDVLRYVALTATIACLFPLIVIDEIFAAPKFRQMCSEGTKIIFDKNTIQGTTVYRQPSNFPYPEFSLVGLRGYFVEVVYTAQLVESPVISYKWFSIKGGFLIRSLGISQTTSPLLFEGICRPQEEPWQQTFIERNQLTIIDAKGTK